MSDRNILLESGTNEVEIAEFILASQCFGVNVAKIKEFVQYDRLKITKPPGIHSSMQGIFLLRNKTVPLIDLELYLNIKAEKRAGRQIVLITEFNNIVMGFVIGAVNRIHRVSWKNIQPLGSVLQKFPLPVTGSVNIEGTEVLILDLERIVGEVIPEVSFGNAGNEQKYIEAQKVEKVDKIEMRKMSKLMLAEDSTTIRNHIIKALSSVGYDKITAFENGQDAFNAIVALKKRAENEGLNITDLLTLIILDIEMPQMDGLTLCKKIKTELNLASTPVLIFSSLINEQMALKCKKVGADGYITKPSMPQLIELIDKYCIKDAS